MKKLIKRLSYAICMLLTCVVVRGQECKLIVSNGKDTIRAVGEFNLIIDTELDYGNVVILPEYINIENHYGTPIFNMKYYKCGNVSFNRGKELYAMGQKDINPKGRTDIIFLRQKEKVFVNIVWRDG